MELFITIIILIAVFVVFAWIYTRGDVLTGSAMVVSHRMEAGSGGGSWRSSNWNYLVTFRFSDHDELELYVSESQYGELKEGLTGQIVWHKDVLSEFIPDMEVTV